MRMRNLAATAAATALLGGFGMTPAHAAYPEFSITVTPANGHPTDGFTVTGDATDPVCENDGVAVNLFYIKGDGNGAAVSVNTVTDAAGHFTANLTVPSDAAAAYDASISAVIADCTPPSLPTDSRASETVSFDIRPNSGTFTMDKTSGKPGQVLHYSGTNCWGGKVTLRFGTTFSTGTVAQDKTFTGSFTLPNAGDGTYQVQASCPSTDFAVRSFRLINPAVVPPAPPAKPIKRPVNFTG